MTFVDELKQLSASVALRHKLERQLAEIKTKMKTAASSGHRGFKIDIITLLDSETSVVCLPDINAENYYCIFTSDEAFYIEAISEFLEELGFDPSEIAYTKRSNLIDGYSSMLITILW
jgi:hypothetical protein